MAIQRITDKIYVHQWVVPYIGNKHTLPYGTLRIVVDDDKLGEYAIFSKIHTSESYKQYVIIDKKRYIVTNVGRLYNPKIQLELWEKTKVNNRWKYV
jgi:hypothetical protein